MKDSQKRLMLALDLPSARSAELVVKQFVDTVGTFKVGSELFLAEGPAISDLIIGLGAQLFVDLKLHDIPRTVEAAAKALAKQGAHFITVHASGGRDMLAAALQGASYDPKCQVLAVTVLTSQDDETLAEIGVTGPLTEQVLRLAELADEVSVPGFVCSAAEAPMLRQTLGTKPVLVCPGIRPSGGKSHDQKRIATPREAILAGADYLVVGRAILEASDRRAAILAISDEIGSALAAAHAHADQSAAR
jgi:orotidine-5'-phosphate decarboxylase